MQLIPRYLVSNKTDIIANEAGFVTEYRPVYTRQLEVYKGIDNVLQFKLLNADQKPIDIDLYTPKFMAFDENDNLIVEHDCEILQQGDSTGYTYKGLFKVTITENDLLNVKDQYLSYVIYLVDSNNSNVLTYSSAHFENKGIIKVSSGAFPGPSPTYEITQFSQTDDSEWVSESITAQPAINGNEALHTAVVYTDAYAGDIIIQATLENQVTGATAWSDVKTITFDGTETSPVPVNFNGVFNFLRFKVDASPTETITKILVRN